jgi:hypothetical protein
MNFGDGGPEKIITRANLKASLQAYEEVSRHISWREDCVLYLMNS